MLILDLWGISFHAVVFFALGKNLLFKFALGHCVYLCCFVIRVPSGDFHMKDLIHRIFFFYVYGPVLVSMQVCSLPILACFTHFYCSTITSCSLF